MNSIAEYNDDHRFLLTCVDAVSKYASVVLMRNKTGKEVVRAFKEILASGRKPDNLQSDKGKEFLNTPFQKLLKKEGIHYYTCNNPDIKCSLVKRFNRTIKGRIWKYFTKSRSCRYMDVLSDLVQQQQLQT